MLGPPLAFLPRNILEAELHAYREDYQAFRAGRALGARGELTRLCPTPEETSGWSSPTAAAPAPAAGSSPSALGPGDDAWPAGGGAPGAQRARQPTRAGTAAAAGSVPGRAEEDQAYYSEPERFAGSLGRSPSVASEAPGIMAARRRMTLDETTMAAVGGSGALPGAAGHSFAPQRGRAAVAARAGLREPGSGEGRRGPTSSSSSPSVPSAQRMLFRREVRPVSVLRSFSGQDLAATFSPGSPAPVPTSPQGAKTPRRPVPNHLRILSGEVFSSAAFLSLYPDQGAEAAPGAPAASPTAAPPAAAPAEGPLAGAAPMPAATAAAPSPSGAGVTAPWRRAAIRSPSGEASGEEAAPDYSSPKGHLTTPKRRTGAGHVRVLSGSADGGPWQAAQAASEDGAGGPPLVARRLLSHQRGGSASSGGAPAGACAGEVVTTPSASGRPAGSPSPVAAGGVAAPLPAAVPPTLPGCAEGGASPAASVPVGVGGVAGAGQGQGPAPAPPAASVTLPVPAAPASAAAAAAAFQGLDFVAWLQDEVRSRPDEAQLLHAPQSHLSEVARAPWRLEKLLGFGFFLCLDILLHELSFTPLQALRSIPRLLSPWRREPTSSGSQRLPRLTVTEQGDLLRFSLLLLNVVLVTVFFDDSKIYHYIRRESFLKLYVVFNMLEMFERWCRSVGVDLFDLLAASAHRPWGFLLPRFAATLLYCFGHSTMHLLRVLLINVAINTSSSAVFLIIVTNNFGEIKSTVFKRYGPESLFPIITSDIVERFYLVADILFVLARLSISPRRGAYSSWDIAQWLALLMIIEVGTDWVKFCLIFKFSEMKASTLEVYKEVLMADILLCRAGGDFDVSRLTKGAAAGAAPQGTSGAGCKKDHPRPTVAYRGIHSFSHSLARRIGFCGVPFSTLVVVQAVMLLRSPCSKAVRTPPLLHAGLFIGVALLLALLSKVLMAASLLGYAARRRGRIQKGLELFPRIKAL